MSFAPTDESEPLSDFGGVSLPVTSTAPYPRTAVFYSTIRHWNWGAPDYIWPTAARRLRAAGVRVIAVLRPHIRNHPAIRTLADAGALVLPQPPLVYRRGLVSKLRIQTNRLSSSTRVLRRTLQRAERPHFFIDQSACFDFLDEVELLDLIQATSASYDLFCHLNRYESPLGEERRREAGAFMAGANRVLFNSSWVRQLAELQILRSLPNAGQFEFDVRFPHETPIAWPAEAPIRLASVSRIDCHHKGLDVLLRGLALLPSDTPDWRMDFYGDGPDSAYIRGLTTWLGLDHRVQFHGAVADVRQIWRECHMLVLVSRHEGLGVSMLEAMACGRPVLRTPYGGCREWIEDAETGFVCPAPEPELIAASLERALRQYARWPAMGIAAHARIRAQLNPAPEDVYLSAFGLASTP